mmetsp:Transcript_13299/g.34111  ORF Transcript_13299/g.34111 Transcript_13299/m.34111 type:complete len:214 (+) Transcript_13299:304-945(+)
MHDRVHQRVRRKPVALQPQHLVPRAPQHVRSGQRHVQLLAPPGLHCQGRLQAVVLPEERNRHRGVRRILQQRPRRWVHRLHLQRRGPVLQALHGRVQGRVRPRHGQDVYRQWSVLLRTRPRQPLLPGGERGLRVHPRVLLLHGQAGVRGRRGHHLPVRRPVRRLGVLDQAVRPAKVALSRHHLTVLRRVLHLRGRKGHHLRMHRRLPCVHGRH